MNHAQNRPADRARFDHQQQRGRNVQLTDWRGLQSALDANTPLSLLQLAQCVKKSRGNPNDRLVQTLAERFDAIIAHTASREPRQLNDRTFGQWMYGLPKYPTRTVEQKQAVETLLRGSADLLENHSIVLDAQATGNTLYCLKNLGNSRELDDLLAAIAKQLEGQNAPHLNAQEIGNGLYGLQNLVSNAAVERVLAVIAKQLEGQNAQQLTNLDLAENLFSLERHLDSEAARSLVAAMYNRTGIPMPAVENLMNPGSLQEILYELCASTHIRPDRFHRATTEIDLHGLSHRLAEKFCAVAIDHYLASEDTSHRRIVFGRAGHRVWNAGKMRAVVERLLTSERFAPRLRVLAWQDGAVRVAKKA